MSIFLLDIEENQPTETDENVPIWIHHKNLRKYNLLPNVAKAIDDSKKNIWTLRKVNFTKLKLHL